MPPAVSTSRPAPDVSPHAWAGGRLRMLADQLDYVVGVDPHRDSHSLAVVQVVSCLVVFEATVVASSDGYTQALNLVDEYAPGRRAFAIEGTVSFGAGLTRFPTGPGAQGLAGSPVRRRRPPRRRAPPHPTPPAPPRRVPPAPT